MSKIKFIFNPILLFLLCIGSAEADSQEVAEAYSSIPHRQTTYQAAKAQGISLEQAKQLEGFFAVVDQAVVARVQAIQWLWGLQTGQGKGASMERYVKRVEKIKRQLLSLSFPTNSKSALQLVAKALEQQLEFLKIWNEEFREKGKFEYDFRTPGKHHKLVNSSSSKLKNAYSILIANYPKESTHNRQAFFDHLCALDFI